MATSVPQSPSGPAPVVDDRFSSAPRGGWLLRNSIRLRHVRRLVMRNLETKFKVPLDCYFALCPAGGGEPFYTSDVERQTLNPMWKSISLSRFGSSLRVGVYVRTGDSGVSAETKASTDTKGPGAGWEPLLERDVDLSKLEFVQPVDRGQGIGSLQLIRAPNTLVFELADGIYMDSASAPKFSPRLPAKKTKPPLKITVAAILRQHTGLCGEPGAQYGFSQCMRALNEQKKFESELNGALMRNESRESNPRRVRASTARLERTRELVRKEQGELKTQLEVVRAVREELKPRCFQVLRLWEQLERHRQAMDKLSQQFNHLQKQRAVAATRLHLRKARMLWSLFNLYPIRKEVKSIGGQPMYYIRDCPMPDILAEGSALPVSVALGYCAHLILLAAKYLGVKLRYRIVHGGSKSVILDEAAATPWRVTLYYKDSDRRTIHRAIAMLHTDVMQLITTCKVAPSKETEGGSGAHLLSNIYNLQKSILPRQMQPQSPTTTDAE